MIQRKYTFLWRFDLYSVPSECINHYYYYYYY